MELFAMSGEYCDNTEVHIVILLFTLTETCSESFSLRLRPPDMYSEVSVHKCH